MSGKRFAGARLVRVPVTPRQALSVSVRDALRV